MKRLGDWLGREPLPVTDVVGWLVRLAKGLEPLHALGEPHGRLSANAVHCVGPEAGSQAQLIATADVARDFSYFSAVRARRRVGPSPADDVWALGVLLYRGLTCAYPFPGDGRKGVAERIEWRPASPIEVYGVEHERLQALLDRVFHSDPVRRLTTVPELVAALIAIEPEASALPGLELDRPTAAEGRSSASDEPDIEAVVVAEAPLPASPPGAKPVPPAEPIEAAAVDEAGAPAEVVDETEGVEEEGVEVAPAAAPAGAPRPRSRAPRQRSSLLEPAVLVPFFALAVVAGYAFLRPRWGGSTDPASVEPTARAVAPATTGSASADPSSSVSPSHPSAPPVTTSAPPPPSTEASASSAPPSDGPAVPSRPANRLQCLSQLFPPRTFEGGRPNLHFLCAEADPRKGADALGSEIALAKGHRDTTEAMWEWDKLGWFQMAMFAVARASCCEAAAPLQSGLDQDACQFDGALIAIGEAVVHGGEDDLAVAMARYLDAIVCLVDRHYAHAFGEKGPPAPREQPAFEEAARRVRAARGG